MSQPLQSSDMIVAISTSVDEIWRNIYLRRYDCKMDMYNKHERALNTLGHFMYGAFWFWSSVADGFYNGPTKQDMEKDPTIPSPYLFNRQQRYDELAKELIPENHDPMSSYVFYVHEEIVRILDQEEKEHVSTKNL